MVNTLPATDGTRFGVMYSNQDDWDSFKDDLERSGYSMTVIEYDDAKPTEVSIRNADETTSNLESSASRLAKENDITLVKSHINQ